MADVEASKADAVDAKSAAVNTNRKGGPNSHLRAEAPAFRPEELPRPANLKSLKTRRPPSRLEALDLVPFTPSQGVLTPSPNNLAATIHHDTQHLYPLYPRTPQTSASQVAFPDQGFPQSAADESSGNSYTSTFSPFHWPMPVSPTAFPVRQGHMMAVMDPSQAQHYPAWAFPGGGSEYMFPMQPGSPAYMSPGSPLVGAAWNHQPFTRQRSRLAGAPPPAMMMVPSPGSPMFSMPQSDFHRHGMSLMFPLPESPTFGGSGGPPSPMWAPSMPVPHMAMQPPTPTRPHGHGHKPAPPFLGVVPLTPDVVESQGASREATPDRQVRGNALHPAFRLNRTGDPPRLNARQRRTMRRAEERAAKAKAELAAQQNQSESGQQAESSQQQREWDLLAEIAEKTADEEEGSESEAPVESHPLGEEPEDHQAA